MDTHSLTPAEHEIYDGLSLIRDQLLECKVTAATSDHYWRKVGQLVKKYYALSADTAAETPGAENGYSIDLILDDVVPLFFQFWSQTGSVSKEMFPAYVRLAKLLHQLNLWKNSGVFSLEMLQASRNVMREVAESIGVLIHAEHLLTGSKYKHGENMVMEKVRACSIYLFDIDDTIGVLAVELEGLSPSLIPIHTRLVQLKGELEAIIARKSAHSFSLAEVQVIQDEVRSVDSARIDGKFMTEDQVVVPGQAAVIELLELCFEDVHELLAAREPVSGVNVHRPAYEELIQIRSRLEYLQRCSKWTLKPEDLHPMQQKLGKIDSLRVDGKFVDESGNCPPGQAVLHFLLHKCYRLVYKLQISSEPVADSLMPVFQQLVTLQKCLTELTKWKIELNEIELMPYRLKLSGIQSARVDGRFQGEGGEQSQELLNELLRDCHTKFNCLESGKYN